jgi:uncharacterized protein
MPGSKMLGAESGTELKVRAPHFDFSDLDPRWAPENPEAAQGVNASGMVPAYIEPFLIKVVNRAKALLDPVEDADLIAAIDWFNKQEGQHYKMHRAQIKWIRDKGYEGMAEYEAAYERDYERFLAEKSLQWLLAYCDGFEATGALVSPLWVDGAIDASLGAGADPRPRELWRWHLAEEYEHRMVVFDLYKRLYGKPKLRAWLYRVYGFVWGTAHIQKNVNALRKYLVKKDRESMSAEEIEQSKLREKKAESMKMKAALKLLPVFSPFYTPAKAPRPKNFDAVLDRY